MESVTKVLLETVKLSNAFSADTSSFPITITFAATPSKVITVSVNDSRGNELRKTCVTIQAYVNRLSRCHPSPAPDTTLRKRRVGGGGAIVQVENPTLVLLALKNFVGGVRSGQSLVVTANNERELSKVFQGVAAVA